VEHGYAVVPPLVVRLTEFGHKTIKVLTANVSLAFLDRPPKIGMRVDIPQKAGIANIHKTFQ